MASDRVDRIIKSLDGRFSPEHEEALRRLLSFRRRLTSSFEPGFVRDVLVDLVERSEFVDFFNRRARKFIDERQPIFRLRVPITEEVLEAYPDERFSRLVSSGLSPDNERHLAEATGYKLMVLHAEVMDPLLTVLYERIDRLVEDDEAAREDRDAAFRALPDKEDLGRFLIPNIFKVLVESVKGDLVVMEYVP